MSEDPIPPAIGDEPAAVTQPIGGPAPVPATGTPVAAGTPAVGTPAAATPAAGTPVLYTPTPVSRRGPWWEYLAVGLAGLVLGAALWAGFSTLVHHVGNGGRGDGRGHFQRFDRRGGPQGPRWQGPGPGLRGGPGTYGNNNGNNNGTITPSPSPTTSG